MRRLQTTPNRSVQVKVAKPIESKTVLPTELNECCRCGVKETANNPMYGVTGSEPKKYECGDTRSCSSRQYDQKHQRLEMRMATEEDLRHMDRVEQFEYLFNLPFDELQLHGEQARDAITRYIHVPTGDKYNWVMCKHGWAKQ